MARSVAIWTVTNQSGQPVAMFTVKWECVRWCENAVEKVPSKAVEYRVCKMPDGEYDGEDCCRDCYGTLQEFIDNY